MLSPVRPQTAVESATSWKEMTMAMDKERRTLPWSAADAPKPVRVDMFARKTKERELDPIVMKFRDAKQEETHAANRTMRTETLPLQRLDNLRKTNFNIVSHEGPPRKIDVMPEHLKTKKPPQRDWHLFSHLHQDKHVTCPILFDADYMVANTVPKTGPALSPSRLNPRDFHIINNRFAQDHDEKLRAEYDSMKDAVVKKYWQTHNMDLIRAEYYSDTAEESARRKEFEKSKTHGQASFNKLPPSFKYSEGNSYNILTTEIKDPELARVTLQKDSRAANRLTKFKGLPKQQRLAGEEDYALWQSRRLARVSYKRWEAELDRSYNFVTPAVQIDPHSRKEPLPRKDPTLWARVTTAPSSQTHGHNATGDVSAGSAGSLSLSLSASTGSYAFTNMITTSGQQQQQQQQQQPQSQPQTQRWDFANTNPLRSSNNNNNNNDNKNNFTGGDFGSARDTGRRASTARNLTLTAPAPAPAPSPSPVNAHSSANMTLNSRVPSLDMKAVATVRTGGLSEYAL